MSDISGVSPVAESSPPPEVPQATAVSGSVGGGVASGVKTMAELELVAKPLADAIKYAIASNTCSAATRSNNRMKELLQEQNRKN